MRHLRLLAIVLLCAGCATGKDTTTDDIKARFDRYERLATQKAPPTWSIGSSWAFVATNSAGQIDQSAVFRVTDQPVDACLSGDWKKLEVVKENGLTTHSPAYVLDGRNLLILLSTALCDVYPMYSGALDEKGFTGIHSVSGLTGGEEYGQVLGVPVLP